MKKFSSFSKILKEDAHKRNCLTVYLVAGTTLSEMPTSVALPTSHHFHPSLSPVVSLSSGILHEWMRTQTLAKPSSNLLQRTGGDHRGGRTQPGWRTFMMTCLCWILAYMRLEIWRKIGLSPDWCLCTALRTRSGACSDNPTPPQMCKTSLAKYHYNYKRNPTVIGEA